MGQVVVCGTVLGQALSLIPDLQIGMKSERGEKKKSLPLCDILCLD